MSEKKQESTAFQLMEYKCEKCLIEETIWNSTDGEVPEYVDCQMCGHDKAKRLPEEDEYCPVYDIQVCERVIRDGQLVMVDQKLLKEIKKEVSQRKEELPNFSEAVPDEIPEDWVRKMEEVQRGLLYVNLPSEALNYALKGEGTHEVKDGWLKENGYLRVCVAKTSLLGLVVTLQKEEIAHYIRISVMGGGGIIYEKRPEKEEGTDY